MKNKKKIFFISYGTGGAEIVHAIYRIFANINKEKDIRNIVISKYAKNKNPDSIYIPDIRIIKFLEDEEPDIVINETSNGLHIQNEITSFCKDNNILNISILDFYGNYEERFLAIPDKIIVPSNSIYSDLIEFGFNKEDIFIGGNASFDRFKTYKYDKQINKEVPNILYASQGPDKFHVFEAFYRLIAENFNDFTVKVKTHPQVDANGELERLIDAYSNTTILDFNNQNNFLLECLNYDLIIGHNSTLQVQSYLIGIPVIFYELGGIEGAIQNFKASKFPIQVHPYGDFKVNATEETIKLLSQLQGFAGRRNLKGNNYKPIDVKPFIDYSV